MKHIFYFYTMIGIAVSGCSERDFASNQKVGAKKPQKSIEANPEPTPFLPETSIEASPSPEVLANGGGDTKSVDYNACKSLPAAGKRGYGKCDANSVVVIVNDGKKAEMTCCPVSPQANLFSSTASELFVQRSGFCQADELLTGMIGTSAQLYCSKINTQTYKLSAPIASKYVNGSVAGAMGAIAASYHNSDTCICEEGYIAIGGHTPSDNTCAEKCVKVLQK
ncbi:MAG: hypothetical protein NT027_09565 [Proteobacteria bacterium]|nr:hypothetical protein [Pseudomonadota bacterium]